MEEAQRKASARVGRVLFNPHARTETETAYALNLLAFHEASPRHPVLVGRFTRPRNHHVLILTPPNMESEPTVAPNTWYTDLNVSAQNLAEELGLDESATKQLKDFIFEKAKDQYKMGNRSGIKWARMNPPVTRVHCPECNETQGNHSWNCSSAKLSNE